MNFKLGFMNHHVSFGLQEKAKDLDESLRDYTDPTKCALENDLASHQFFSLVAL